MSNNINPVILTVLNLEVHYGENIILNNASLSIHEGDRIGLVGKNGAGKSTFLKVISGIMAPDSGEVARKRGLVCGYLSQDFTLNETETVYQNIIDGAEEIINLIKEYETISHNSERWHFLEEKIKQKDGWNLEKNIGVLISSLNAPSAERMVFSLSGGEKRRVALAKALISYPELLILDEPTNHLDTNSIEWIEDFLAAYKGTCIFVTHDRYFLDRIATRIVELSNGIFFSHQGNYTDFLINKTEREAIQEVEERKKELYLKRELEWVMRGPRARRTKSKSRLNSYYELVAEKKSEKDIDVDLVIPPAERLGNKVVELVNVGYKIVDKELIKYLNFKFEAGRKLGIIGKNGAGKTTLLRLILGEIKPGEGYLETGELVQFNYIDQSRTILNEEDTVAQSIGGRNDTIKFGKTNITIYSYLRRFLFTDDRINQKVKDLSGGERSRLSLAKILKDGGNFLLLDEPTNDLDLSTLRVLEEALIAFEGCVVVVSHDRYFLNRVCNGILSFEENLNIHFSEGDYDYYLKKREERIKTVTEDNTRTKKETEREKNRPKKLSWKENKELENIDSDIISTEEEVKRIEAIFSDPEFYQKFGTQTEALTAELNAAKSRVEMLYKRWEELELKKKELEDLK